MKIQPFHMKAQLIETYHRYQLLVLVARRVPHEVGRSETHRNKFQGLLCENMRRRGGIAGGAVRPQRTI
jgi:hypothetical protein